MDSCCLVCRSSEVDELISVSCVMSTAGRKSVREMIDIFVNIRASQLLLDNDQESHRLPDHLCDQCLARLDRAYRVWKASRWVSLIKKCDPGAEEHYRVCRICAKGDALVSMFCLCTGRRVQIAAMVEYLVNTMVKPGDRLPPYICMDCLKDVNEGYGFKMDALESIKFFREQSLHPWQKMQVSVDCPKRLVVEVSSKGEVSVVNGLTVVTCTVCSLRNCCEKLKRSCRGCRLEFRNYDEILRKVEEQRKATDEDDLMEVFGVIADYEEIEDDDILDLIKDEVVDGDIGDLMNDEMLVEVEKLAVKEEEYSAKKKEKKPRESKLVPVTTERPSKGDPVGKLEKKSNFITIQTIIEYKCCYEGCFQYGVVVDLEKHFQEAHPTFTPVPSSSPFKCPICGSSFRDENSLKSHYGKPCPLYKCSGTLCPFVTRSHDCAMRHIRRDQNGGYLRHGYPKPINLKHLGTYFVVDKPLDENSFTLKRLHERCCWCGELFMELHELEAHRELVHAVVKAPFQCETCNRPFDSLLSLSRHRSRGSLRTHYYCKTCAKTFWEEPPFKLHKYTEHDTTTEEANKADQIHYNSEICCCGCEEVFASVEQLEEHRREEHPPEDVIGQQFPCESCGKAFPVQKQLQAHLKKYQSGRLYCCLVLGCVFKTTMQALIKNHVTCGSHIDAQGKTITIRRVNPSFYYCCVSRCNFEHSSYDEIVKHVASTHEEKRYRNSVLYWDGPTSFRCEACFKNCGTEAAFLNHKNGRLKRNCRYCKITKLRSELDAHEANCPKRVEFVCEKCSQVFVGRYRYKLHMNSEHGVVIPHLRVNPKALKVICNICGAMVRKPYLATHIQTKHENNRAFKCDHCDARFNAVNMKQIHMKNVHSTIKLYPCRQGCDKRYKHSGDRQRHEKLVHLGITPFVCGICSESFVRDRDLQLHSRKHTGRKLYCCDHCGADYDRLVDFREHQRGCGTAGGGFVVAVEDE